MTVAGVRGRDQRASVDQEHQRSAGVALDEFVEDLLGPLGEVCLCINGSDERQLSGQHLGTGGRGDKLDDDSAHRISLRRAELVDQLVQVRVVRRSGHHLSGPYRRPVKKSTDTRELSVSGAKWESTWASPGVEPLVERTAVNWGACGAQWGWLCNPQLVRSMASESHLSPPGVGARARVVAAAV